MRVSLTSYWTVELDDPGSWNGYKRPDDPPTMNIDGVDFPPAFLRAVAMEGCGVGNGKVIGFDNSWYFLDGDRYPMGIDAMDGALVPYKTIAVDPRFFQMGGKYHICELVGKVMPDGKVHDGIVFARDVGEMIEADHIDFYAGTRTEWKELAQWLPDHVNIERMA